MAVGEGSGKGALTMKADITARAAGPARSWQRCRLATSALGSTVWPRRAAQCRGGLRVAKSTLGAQLSLHRRAARFAGADGYALIRSPGFASEFLLTPLAPIDGIESPALQTAMRPPGSGAPPGRPAPTSPPRSAASCREMRSRWRSMPSGTRTQDHFHIHVDCLRTQRRQRSLADYASQITDAVERIAHAAARRHLLGPHHRQSRLDGYQHAAPDRRSAPGCRHHARPRDARRGAGHPRRWQPTASTCSPTGRIPRPNGCSTISAGDAEGAQSAKVRFRFCGSIARPLNSFRIDRETFMRIANVELAVEIAPLGAELQSIVSSGRQPVALAWRSGMVDRPRAAAVSGGRQEPRQCRDHRGQALSDAAARLCPPLHLRRCDARSPTA